MPDSQNEAENKINNSEQPSEQEAEKQIARETEQMPEPETEQPTEHLSEQETEQSSEQKVEQSTEQEAGQSSEQPAEQSPKQETNQPSERSSAKNDNKRKIPRLIFNIISPIIAALYPVACYFFTEYINFTAADSDVSHLTKFIDLRPRVVISMILLLYFIALILLLIFKRASVANSVLGGIIIIFSFVNYYKFVLTGDNFFPWDLLNAKNAGEVAGFVNVFPPKIYIALALLLVILAVLQYFGNTKLNLKFFIRLPIALVMVCAIIFAASTTERASKFVTACGMGFENTGLQVSNYTDNGFVGGFTVNAFSMHIPAPANYSEETVGKYLEKYQSIPQKDSFSNPDIIVVLSESFWDPKLIPGSTFRDREGNEVDPIANFTEIASRKGAYSGKLSTSAAGGGTVRPEFEILTGMTVEILPSGCTPYQYLKRDTASYVSKYKNMGYSTYSVHPYLANFYSRASGYEYIGIDNMNFEDEIFERSNNTDWQWEYRARFVSDKSFAEYIEMTVDESEDPAFLMGISMQAHQPYDNKYTDEELAVIADNPSLSDSTLYTFRRYTMSMYDADNALGMLVRWMDERERDTVLVYFGDHIPTLGNNFAAYTESGLISSPARTLHEDRLATQTTPFLIYANFALGESDILHEGTDNEVATYNLLNAMSQLIGTEQTPYMQFLSDMHSVCPTYNSRIYANVGDELKYYVDGMRTVTYDRLFGKRYSVD